MHIEALRAKAEAHLQRKAYLQDSGAFNHRYLPDIRAFSWYRGARDAIRRSRFVCIMAPPGSGKTRGITVAETVRRIALDRTVRIGLFSKSEDKAKNFMFAVKAILEREGVMSKDFGPFINRTCEANSEKIRVLGATDDTTPTLSNMGVAGQAESLRFHLIILDDPIDRETAFSQPEVQKFIDRVKYTFIPRLEPGGQMLIIGSRFCERDGYHWVVQNSLFRDGCYVLPALDERGESTISERFTTAQLLDIKDGINQGAEGEEVTTAVWDARYMQNPGSDERRPFKLEWLEQKWTEEIPDFVVASVDPAYTTAKGNDYMGGVAYGRARDGRDIIVVGMMQEWVASGHAQLISAWGRDNGARSGPVETNNAKTLGNELRNLGWGAIDVTARGDKIFRIGALEPWFRRKRGDGAILLHERLRGTKEYAAFVQEYVYFPGATHDHILDALAQGVEYHGAVGRRVRPRAR